MKSTEVNDNLIGKRCKSIFTGKMVTGTISEVLTTKYTTEVKVDFDKPQIWANEEYNYAWLHARICDEFGSLRHLELIDDKYETIKVIFKEPITKLDNVFTSNYNYWQTVNLKEWIDNYESSRFTQLDECTAIITSEYNMDAIKEWLNINAEIQEIKSLI